MELFERWESNVRGYARTYPTVFKSASNARQTDESGKSYIDFFAGAGLAAGGAGRAAGVCGQRAAGGLTLR